jgi:cytochrome c553
MKTSRNVKPLIASAIAAAWMFAGVPIAGAADGTPIDAAALWAKNCASCHAKDGTGDTKMGKKLKINDLTSAEVIAKFDRARMIEATKNGVKAEDSDKLVMKGYSSKLSDAQIEAITDWIIAGFK